MRNPIIRIILCVFFFLSSLPAIAGNQCNPTEPDMLGPFYKAGAPERSQVGEGYILSGVVRSSRDCSPIPGATIEFWLAGPDGRYGDNYRATVHSGPEGEYSFESNPPGPYYGRPPHIHIRVSAKGFKTLITQHYPKEKAERASLDLVLIPE